MQTVAVDRQKDLQDQIEDLRSCERHVNQVNDPFMEAMKRASELKEREAPSSQPEPTK